jgi:hypothetical protein
VADDSFSWASLVQWFFVNPEKFALFLVILVGAWRWLIELWREMKEENRHETLLESLLRENKELRIELREYRRKIKQANNGDEPSGRP